MNLRKAALLVLIVFLLALASCKSGNNPESDNNMKLFKNEKYGFSFKYPAEWEEVTRDLPDKWAILDKDKNTILFTVAESRQKNLTILGRYYALKDLYDENQVIRLSVSDLEKIYRIVKINEFSGKDWYTYGIKFSEKNVDSLISGTVCNETEITLVVISNPEKYESYKILYEDMLKSFSCQ